MGIIEWFLIIIGFIVVVGLIVYLVWFWFKNRDRANAGLMNGRPYLGPPQGFPQGSLPQGYSARGFSQGPASYSQ